MPTLSTCAAAFPPRRSGGLFPSPLRGGVRGGGPALAHVACVKLRPPSLTLPLKSLPPGGPRQRRDPVGGGNAPERGEGNRPVREEGR
jgi:hypothetical protein